MQGMQNGLSGLVMLGIPQASTIVQDRYQIRMHLLQLATQGFGKECMIAIPLSPAIEGHDKYIGLLELLEQLLTASLLHNCVTKRGSEPFKDGGRKQKRLHLRWLLSEDDFSQIVQDIALIPTNLLEQLLRINPVRQGNSKHTQAP